jgi:hypothetical protein
VAEEVVAVAAVVAAEQSANLHSDNPNRYKPPHHRRFSVGATSPSSP